LWTKTSVTNLAISAVPIGGKNGLNKGLIYLA
jgi:hypothetical protein